MREKFKILFYLTIIVIELLLILLFVPQMHGVFEPYTVIFLSFVPLFAGFCETVLFVFMKTSPKKLKNSVLIIHAVFGTFAIILWIMGPVSLWAGGKGEMFYFYRKSYPGIAYIVSFGLNTIIAVNAFVYSRINITYSTFNKIMNGIFSVYLFLTLFFDILLFLWLFAHYLATRSVH